MKMLVCIDGTGDSDNDAYEEDMWRNPDRDKVIPVELRCSFVRRIYLERRILDSQTTEYFRGPSTDDVLVSTAEIVRQAYAWVTRNLRIDQQIYMVGWSRGAAACLAVAALLEGDNKAVKCIVMFDAVERSLWTNTATVPSNVAKAYHAVRSDKFASRWYFGHTGRMWNFYTTLYQERVFEGTHSALGGIPCDGDKPRNRLDGVEYVSVPNVDDPGAIMPIPIYSFDLQEDVRVAYQVQDWIWPKLRKEGFFS